MERYDIMNNIKLLLNNVPLEKGGEVGGGGGGGGVWYHE